MFEGLPLRDENEMPKYISWPDLTLPYLVICVSSLGWNDPFDDGSLQW